MTSILNFSGLKEPAYIIECDSCGKRSLVAADHKRYCPVCGQDAITPITVTKIAEPPLVIPSKELAELQDDLQMQIVSAVRCYGQGLSKKALDIDVLDDLYLDADYRHRFEDLIDLFLRDAYGIEYESDGESF